jgi:hypothetical protein
MIVETERNAGWNEEARKEFYPPVAADVRRLTPERMAGATCGEEV